MDSTILRMTGMHTYVFISPFLLEHIQLSFQLIGRQLGWSLRRRSFVCLAEAELDLRFERCQQFVAAQTTQSRLASLIKLPPAALATRRLSLSSPWLGLRTALLWVTCTTDSDEKKAERVSFSTRRGGDLCSRADSIDSLLNNASVFEEKI